MQTDYTTLYLQKDKLLIKETECHFNKSGLCDNHRLRSIFIVWTELRMNRGWQLMWEWRIRFCRGGGLEYCPRMDGTGSVIMKGKQIGWKIEQQTLLQLWNKNGGRINW